MDLNNWKNDKMMHDTHAHKSFICNHIQQVASDLKKKKPWLG